MENTAQTTEQNMANIVNNINSSSSTIDTDTSPHGLPEVTPAPRNPIHRGLKATLQDQEIARLQAQLHAQENAEQHIEALKTHLRDREHELALTQRQVYEIMTQRSSPALDFPEAPPYISFTLEAKIQQMKAEKAKRDKELQEAIHYLELQRLTQDTPRRTLETPGPHKLQEKTPRPQDIELQQKLQLQSEAEATLQTTNNSVPITLNPNQNLVDVFKQLALVMKDNNTSDTTEPAHFNGSDGKWDEFYSQLRTYLSAKDWLTTFEHPVGPGAPGFNNEVNKKLYNKLLMLCKTGHAVTYIKKMAEFDGHGAGPSTTLTIRWVLERTPSYPTKNHRTTTPHQWDQHGQAH